MSITMSITNDVYNYTVSVCVCRGGAVWLSQVEHDTIKTDQF